jgi:tetratricopeptide (TPR) repeat protein
MSEGLLRQTSNKFKLLISLLVVGFSIETNAQISECKIVTAELQVMFGSKIRPATMLPFWQNINEECKSTGEYYQKLGSIYLLAGNFDLAKKAYSDGLKFNDDFKFALLAGFADVDANLAMRGIDRDKNSQSAEKLYREVISEFPDNNYAYAQFSVLLLDLGRYDESIVLANQANQLMENYISYRNLTIIYQEHKGEPQKAVESGVAALELSTLLESDRLMMLALAKAYSDLDGYPESLEVIKALMAKDPNIQKYPKFNDTVKEIRDKAYRFTHSDKNSNT